MMISIDFTLALIVIILVPLCLGLISWIIKHSQYNFVKQQNLLGKLNGHIEESVNGHSLIKIYNKEKDNNNVFEQINENLYKTSFKANLISQIASPVMMLLQNLNYIIILIYGAIKCAIDSFTVGQIQAFIIYCKNFTDPLSNILNIFNDLQIMAASNQRINKLLQIPESFRKAAGI